MKFATILLCAAGLAVTSQGSPFCTVVPGTWCEQAVGDAGSLPDTAEITIGGGILSHIIGRIDNGVSGSDMYAILIPNTLLFSASYAPHSGNAVTGDSLAALYLFNANGKGVEAVDDGSTVFTGFTGPAGIYYIAVAPDGNDPRYKTGGNSFDIFNAFVSGSESLPVGGAGAIKNYSQNGCGCEGGYEISLSGAHYAATPEPASMLLAGFALAGMGSIGVIRRRKSVV